jgi:hypothetical protein
MATACGGQDWCSVTLGLTHDEARRIAADGTGPWTSMQIDCVLVRQAFGLAQHRTDKASAESDKQL